MSKSVERLENSARDGEETGEGGGGGRASERVTEAERERQQERGGNAVSPPSSVAQLPTAEAAAVECVPNIRSRPLFSLRRLPVVVRSLRSFAPPSPQMTSARSHLQACELWEESAPSTWPWRGRFREREGSKKKNSFELTDDAGLPQREFVEVVARGVLVLVLDRRRGAAHDLGASRRDQVERVLEREGAGGLHRPAGRAGERWGSSCCCHRFVLESSARKVLCEELFSTSGSRKEKRKHFSSSHPSARALARSLARKDRNEEVNFLIQIDLANLQTDRKKREEKEEREGRKERESPPQTSRSAPRLSLTFAAVVALVVAVDASRALLGHRSKLCRGPRL